MMKTFVRFYIVVVVAFAILTACGGGHAIAVDAEGEELEMQYASLLTLRQCDGYVYVQIRNPWDSTAVLHSYVLVDREEELPKRLPQGDVVRTPLENSVVYTMVHCGLIDELGAFEGIRGVCDLRYNDIDKVRNGVRNGRIRDLGEGLNPNVEDIIDMEPDAILLSPFQNDGGYGRLGKLGIPIVECADYMETSALGRAEWMKFYGRLYGRGDFADSLFNQVALRYDSLRRMAATVEERPTVVTDLKYGAVWYVPGGNSTTGHLLVDAGADYVFKETPESGNLALAPEAVFDRAIDAQFWLIRYNQATEKTYDELAQEYANYANLRAFQHRNVYACNTESTPFYREAPFHPDRLLKDYIEIFHPGLLKGHKNRYYKKIEP